MRLLSIFLLSLLMFVDSASAAPGNVPAWDGKYLTGKHNLVLRTTKGEIALTLDADKAPKAVTNFITLARGGYYDNLTFHRVIDGFMIQGGDPTGDGTGGRSIYGPTFEDEENDLPMVRGTLAMANAGPDTNGSQFFIVQQDSPFLKRGPAVYTTFGIVTKGIDVVDVIANVPKDMNDKPLRPVTFTVTVAGAPKAAKKSAVKKPVKKPVRRGK